MNESPVISDIAKQHAATPGQISLAFLMAEGHIVIPTSSNKTRMAENLAATNLNLSQADMAALRQVDEGRRLVNGGWAPKWDA